MFDPIFVHYTKTSQSTSWQKMGRTFFSVYLLPIAFFSAVFALAILSVGPDRRWQDCIAADTQ